ncbi:MAG: hypothetical protein Q8O57_04050, partial [Kiritimatiellota bacterium]|nr:hypothetical protein [Kiritimatiellota bacterium]
TLPYLPLPGVVYDKFAAMQGIGVSGSMISWIIGGSPGPMLKAAGEASFAPLGTRQEFLQRLGALYGGEGAAVALTAAWERFSESFQRYLCAPPIFYFGPIARCPAYLLHLEKEAQVATPYNWGLTCKRHPQAFEDDISRWTGPYTPGEIIESFREMARIWDKGLEILAAVLPGLSGKDELRQQHAVASAARLQFLSAANVYEFYLLRDTLKKSDAAAQAKIVVRLQRIVADDTALAKKMKELMPLHPGIGFESEMMVYSYSDALLDEKLRHDELTRQRLQERGKSGVDMKVLEEILPTPEPFVFTDEPDQPGWLCHGD